MVTNLAKIAIKICMGILNYIAFLWGIGWRTALFSIVAAIIAGIALGVITQLNNWPPQFIEQSAGLIGLPITLIVFAMVFYRQFSKSRLFESRS